MTPEQFQRARELFEEALALREGEQDAFLLQRCGSDRELLSLVRDLLRRARLQQANQPVDSARVASERLIGVRIGPYRITGVLGQGGMGAVYEAEHERTQQVVALKLIRPGLATPALLRRFEFELQVLARLEHPGIARIYHADTADIGGGPQPFFAMELVRGQNLLEYSKQHELTIRQRLELGARIADAVQYAHQQGVIHRDLKPGNIFVTAEGQPKILDFGVARATDSDVQSTTLQAEIGQLIGTLPYMSPEQASGDPNQIDTRSDVYALGVVIYELLTGRLPYLLQQRMIHDVLRIIREEEPTRLSSLNRMLRGDVETIIGKALEKDKDRRYVSADALAADIRRHLNDEPIAARPPSATYQLAKFARRNKALVGGVATTFVILVAGIIGIGIALNRARAAEAESRRLATAESVARRDADAKRVEAETARGEAVRAAETIENNSYVANIQMAAAAMDLGQLGRVRQRLDACPVRLRGWEWSWLNARTDNSLLELRGRAGKVHSVAFSPDGTRIVSVVEDDAVRVWDATKGEALVELKPPTGTVYSAAFSPDGQRIVTASEDRIARVWDAASGGLLLELSGHWNVKSIAFSPDGTRITGSEDTIVYVWDAVTGVAVAELGAEPDGFPPAAQSPTFSPDSTRIITASFGESVARVWDAVTGTALLELKNGTDGLSSVAFSPDGKRIITGSNDGMARVFDAATGAVVFTLRHADENEGWTPAIEFVGFNADGTRIVTSAGTSSRVWDASTGAALIKLVELNGEPVAFSSDKRLIVTSTGSTAWVYDAYMGAAPLFELRGHTDEVVSAAFSPDSKRIAAGSADGTVRVWDAERAPDYFNTHGGDRQCGVGVFNQSDTRVVTSMWQSTLVSDVATGAALAELEWRDIRAAAFSPDGRRIVVSSPNEPAHICDANTGATLIELNGHASDFTTAAFSPDGKRIVTSGTWIGDEPVCVWNVATGAHLIELQGHATKLTSAVFSPNGERIVMPSRGETACIWDLASGAQCVELKGHTREVTFAAFSPDGARVITASADSTARIWDAATGAILLELKGHSGTVCSAVFSPDGKRIVTGGLDSALRVWDAATGAAFVDLDGASGANTAVFTPDGSQIVVTNWAFVFMWDSRPYRDRFPAISAARQARAKMDALVAARIAMGDELDAIAQALASDRLLSEVERAAAAAAVFVERERERASKLDSYRSIVPNGPPRDRRGLRRPARLP